MVEVVVRAALPADVTAIALLRWTWVVEEQAEPVDVSRERFVEEFGAWADRHAGTHECFVAESPDGIVGMAWAALTARVPSPRSLHRQVGDLQSVYVLPGFRGAGVGGRLVEAAIGSLARRGAERVVVHSSGRAVPLYARAGLASSDLLRHRTLNAPS